MITLDVFIVDTPANQQILFDQLVVWANAVSNEVPNLTTDSSIFKTDPDDDIAAYAGTVPSIVFYNRTEEIIIGKLSGSQINEANYQLVLKNVNAGLLSGPGDGNPNILTGGLGFGFPKILWLVKGVFCTYKALDSDTQLGQAGFGAGAAYGFYNYFK